jgi:hypothetical protein
MRTQKARGAIWPVGVLTSAFCPEFDPQRLAMAMCVGYFGGHESPPAATMFSVSGFVSSKARWREFETRWSRLLRREGLTAFDANEFLVEAGEFAAGWSEPGRRRRLIETLGRLAEQHVFRAFSQSVNLSDYQAVNAEYALSEAGAGPYGLCAAFLMTSVREWMAAKHPDDLTLFIFEQGDIDQRELHRVLRAARAEIGEPAQIWPRRWRDERGRRRYLRPLEACALFPADHEGVFLKRLAERSLLETRSIGHAQLTDVCRALDIAPRPAPQTDEHPIPLGIR